MFLFKNRENGLITNTHISFIFTHIHLFSNLLPGIICFKRFLKKIILQDYGSVVNIQDRIHNQ
jgi:hypothetical protein